jgi:hypothetical protein
VLNNGKNEGNDLDSILFFRVEIQMEIQKSQNQKTTKPQNHKTKKPKYHKITKPKYHKITKPKILTFSAN